MFKTIYRTSNPLKAKPGDIDKFDHVGSYHYLSISDSGFLTNN